MEIENVWQYLIVAAAILGLLTIKWFAVRKRVSKQVDGFIHPELCLEELKTKLGSPQQAESILRVYLNGSQPSADRLRNIALIVAYLNSQHTKPALLPDIIEYIGSIKTKEGAGLTGVPAKY